MDKYIRFREDPELWEREMDSFGLTKEEKDVLKKHLSVNNGVAAEQEDIMELSMNPRISNFNVAESNLLRKSISKKKADVLEKAKKLFFDKGESVGTSRNLLNYVWDICVMPQAG